MATIKNLDDLKNLDKMEAFKTMSEGMDAKKNKKPHVCGNLVQCVLGIVMLSVGGVVSGVQILFVNYFHEYDMMSMQIDTHHNAILFNFSITTIVRLMQQPTWWLVELSC